MKNRNKSVAFSLHSKLNFKIIIVGHQAVGKSSLAFRFVKDTFSPSYKMSTGVQFYSKIIYQNNQQLALQIWDTAGQQSFRAIGKSFYRLSSCVFILYSNPQQLQNDIKQWMQQINEFANQAIRKILIRTKIDELPCSAEEQQLAQKLTQKYQLDFFMPISSKQNTNIDKLSQKLGQKLFQQYCTNQAFRELVQPTKDSFLLTTKTFNQNEKKKKSCC